MHKITVKKKYEYDIAISVAEENLPVANLIAAELGKKNIRYYLYTENRAKNWGRHILDILLESYGADARYMLIITSRIFVKKYWANIELQVRQVLKKGKNLNILQLRLDKTPVDGISSKMVFEEWNNNPEEIAGILEEKLKLHREKPKPLLRVPLALAGSIAVVAVLGGIFLQSKLAGKGIAANQQTATDSSSVKITKDTNATPNPVIEEAKQSKTFPGASKASDDAGKILIPAATFAMGSDKCHSNEQPVHKINLDSFYISKTEVTVKEYREYCNATGAKMPPQPYTSDDYPVVNVTWYDAKAYCKWKGEGRLPREAEWEYAAGAGLGMKYSGGNNIGILGAYRSNAGGNIDKVGNYAPNKFGLSDMTGNVAEWCSDFYDSAFYARSIGRTDPHGPKSGTLRVVRGGHYNSPVNESHITCRSYENPATGKPYIGFRVVWDK